MIAWRANPARDAARVGALAALYAILAALVLAPFLTLLYASVLTQLPFSGRANAAFTLANYAALWDARIGAAAFNTVIVSLGGACIALAIGGGLAWLAARADIPGKAFIHLAGVTPLFVSLLIAAICWSQLGSGRSGYLNIIFTSLGLPIHIQMQSLAGIIVVFGLYYAPYPFIFIHNALTLIHPEMEEAAAVHGGPVARNARRVTFPLVKPAVIGSFLLIVVLMSEDFPVPDILGGSVGIETLSIRIYKLMTQVPARPNQAAAAAMALTSIVCLLVFFQRWSLAGRDYRTVTGKGARVRMTRIGVWRWPALFLVGLYVFTAIGLPLLALLQGALRKNMFVANASALFDVTQFSLVNIEAALANPALRDGLKNSLIAGGSTALFGSALFFCVAYAVNRTKWRGRTGLEYLTMLPIGVPALVMGLGILWTWIRAPLPIYGTMGILIVAFLSRFLPQGYRAVSSSIQQVHEDLENAAMVAGASPMNAARTITMPLVRGGIVASAVLMVVLGMRELTASLFLYTTDTRVLSIVIFEAYDNGSWGVVASTSLLYTIILVLMTLAGRRFLRANL